MSQTPASAPSPSMFSGIRDAKATQSLYFKDGTYLVRLDNLAMRKNRQQMDIAVIETTIVAVLDDADGKALRVGQEPSQVISRGGKAGDYFLRDIKGFICGALGVSDDEVTEEACARIFADGASPMRGLLVEVNCYTRLSKQGNPITVHRWQGEVSADRAVEALDAKTIARFFPNPKHPITAKAIEKGLLKSPTAA